MGVDPSAKETSLHHIRDPLLDLISADADIDLLGIILFGSSDKFSEKILASTRAAILAQGMRADGAVAFCEGSGNNHVDFANLLTQLENRNIAAAGLTVMGKNGQPVVNNDYTSNVIDICKSSGSIEPCVLGQNNLIETDCRKALAMLKLKMRKADKERGI
ncbi:MAG: hypothetical protein IJ520_10525 [Synergistaceae bacterium]|nr:hypothetical protein [Synergistaceae bacterium]